MRILMVGLDEAGKTTILYKLKTGEIMPTIPTFGYNDEIIKYGNISLMVFDVGGKFELRPLWKLIYEDKDCQGFIFVVDSSNRKRITEARNELANMLKMEDSEDAVVLVYANKQDLPNAMTADELINALNLTNLKTRRWYLQVTSATQGQGLNEGLDWLVNELAKKSGDVATTPPPPEIEISSNLS